MKSRIVPQAALCLGLGLLLFLPACKGGEQAGKSSKKELQQTIDSLRQAQQTSEASDKRPGWAPVQTPLRTSEAREHDLIHTRLDVRFDWQQQHLNGSALLRLSPWFYETDSVVLDAKGFDIHKVELPGGKRALPLEYTYDGRQLRIALPRTMTRTDTFELYIKYTAKPEELDLKASSAITGAQGLYFINPTGQDPNTPRQIWTQGETESASAWFPTFDQPNVRTTQTIYMTVDTQFVTLSNGTRTRSVQNNDGTRTDVWQMDQPHAPYLFMMAVGDFAVVADEWRGRPVNYYVEPAYRQHAEMIFGMTPAMMEFYSQKLGYDYPWPKYSQVVVRNFVSGAMENTSATVMFSRVQQDARAYLDRTYESLIAHELIHHWFGDLVTCESWANIALNEAFATYGEYLWFEHRYGQDRADFHLDQDLEQYLSEATSKREPLIRYNYAFRDDVFDAHSYQKGGRILHMLRYTLGDSAFFAGLKHYLHEHAYSAVEVAELRIALEEVCGRSLLPFFQQWFHSPGHMELKIDYARELSADSLSITVQQTQNLDYMPVYKMPVHVQVVTGQGQQFYDLRLESQDTTFRLPVVARAQANNAARSNGPDEVQQTVQQIKNVDFDCDHYLLNTTETSKPTAWWITQYKTALNYKQRNIALRKLREDLDQEAVASLYHTALQDTFYGIRKQAVNNLGEVADPGAEPHLSRVLARARKDPNAKVRAAAIDYLRDVDLGEHPEAVSVLKDALDDSSYSVLSKALYRYHDYDAKAGLKAAKRKAALASDDIRFVVADILLEAGDPMAGSYVPRALDKMSGGFSKLSLLQSYGDYLADQDSASETVARGIAYLQQQALNAAQWYIRWGAARSLKPFRNHPKMQGFFDKLRKQATHPRVKGVLEDL